jgi:hypothetical protein
MEKKSSKHGQKKKKMLVRESDNQIQLEWRRVIEKTLYNFIRTSSLKNIASFIGTDYYGNMSPFLVNKILGMATPASGIHLGLNAMIETMRDTCSEAANLILIESGNPLNLPKTPISITLLCETINMPSITYEQMMTDEEYIRNTPLQTRHVLTNDQTRDWLKQYRDAKKETIDVFTVRMGPGNSKATNTTGRYLVSVLMPLCDPNYRLVPCHEPHSTAWEELEHKYRSALIELTSHKRLAELATKGKTTPFDEALILARQAQHTELIKLKHLSADQGTLIATLQRQNSELQGILNSPAARDVKSLQNTILILTDKLKQVRRKVVLLMTEVKTLRAREHLEKGTNSIMPVSTALGSTTTSTTSTTNNTTHKKKASLTPTTTSNKRQKTENGYIKKEEKKAASISTVSSSYSHTDDDDDDDEDEYDDDDSQYDSNNNHSEGEEDEEDYDDSR